MELNIVKHIKKYGLEKAIIDFDLICKENGNLILLKYNQISSPMDKIEVQESRGLILEKGTYKVISMAFMKFFNHGETNAANIDWDSAHVLDKLDGSLLSLYHYNDTWNVCTTGTINGEGEVNNKYGTTFRDLFWGTINSKYNFNINKLNSDYIYAFELTTPYNIVVKPHSESSATLLTIRNRENLKEIPYNELIPVANELGVPLVKRYDFNIKNVDVLIKTFENMPWSEEGYIVLDGNFSRIKIKNPAYVAVHLLKNRTSEHSIMEIVKSNEIEEFASTFIERREEIYNLHKNYNELINKLENIWKLLEPLKPKDISPEEKKRYAMEVFRVCEENDIKMFTGLYFGLNDGKIESIGEYMMNYDNKRLYQIL
jgi:hypothetical protein